jgi:BolA protein
MRPEALNVVPAPGIQITAEAIALQLRGQLNPTQLEVIDESAQHAGHVGANATGQGSHFRVRIASPFFNGKRRIQQHRLVYDALQQFMLQGVHALAIEIID